MKKVLFLLGFITLFFGCSNDDDNNDNDVELTEIIRITAINTQENLVTLTNLGTAATNISDYQLCLGPGTYVGIEASTIAPDESITISYVINETAGGLSIFSTGGSFSSTDPEILIDYVQWGDADQARVDQAVTANRWDNASNYLEGGPIYTFIGEANDVGSDFW